jgi:hypothetical protein
MNSQDQNFQAFLQTGRKIILDTKAKKTTSAAVKKMPAPKQEGPSDPHTSFVKHVVQEKPKPKYLLEFFEEEIKREEAKL